MRQALSSATGQTSGKSEIVTKEQGLTKKTISIVLPGNKKHHLVSYFRKADVTSGFLKTPSSLGEFADMVLDRSIYSELLDAPDQQQQSSSSNTSPGSRNSSSSSAEDETSSRSGSDGGRGSRKKSAKKSSSPIISASVSPNNQMYGVRDRPFLNTTYSVGRGGGANNGGDGYSSDHAGGGGAVRSTGGSGYRGQHHQKSHPYQPQHYRHQSLPSFPPYNPQQHESPRFLPQHQLEKNEDYGKRLEYYPRPSIVLACHHRNQQQHRKSFDYHPITSSTQQYQHQQPSRTQQYGFTYHSVTSDAVKLESEKVGATALHRQQSERDYQAPPPQQQRYNQPRMPSQIITNISYPSSIVGPKSAPPGVMIMLPPLLSGGGGVGNGTITGPHQQYHIQHAPRLPPHLRRSYNEDIDIVVSEMKMTQQQQQKQHVHNPISVSSMLSSSSTTLSSSQASPSLCYISITESFKGVSF